MKVTAPVKTFFLGLIGMNTITISRQAHAEYVLPVPMGSPENYYGVFGDVRNATFTTTGHREHPTANTSPGLQRHTSNSWDTRPTLERMQCATPWRTRPMSATNNNAYAASTATSGSEPLLARLHLRLHHAR